MAGAAKLKESLWDVAFFQLPEEQQKPLKTGLILPFRFEDLKTTIDTAREHASSKWKITTRHGEIDIRAKFGDIVSWVQKFIDVGDIAVNYDPGHAALPWAAVRFVLQIMVNNTTRAAKFVEGLEQVAFYIYDSTIRENLYLAMEPSGDSNDLKNHILTLYASILQFLLKARLFFEASSTKRMLSSITKSADDVIQLLAPVAQQASQIATISSRIDARTQISTLSLSNSHTKSMEWLRHQMQTNDTVISSLITSMTSNHRETMNRFDKIEESYEQHDRVKILSWLSAIPYHQHHKKAYSEVLKGTGSWLFEDSEYIRWRDSEQSAMLSLLIQEAFEDNGDSPKPLYFYCSSSAAEPERAQAEDIMRSLVKQLSIGGAGYEPKPIPKCVVERYGSVEKEGFASGGLLFDESCDLISKIATDRDQGRLTVMVDGLDECSENARHLLIQGFNDIMRTSSTAVVKLLISSRDSPYLTTYFEEHHTYEICVESSRNQEDIDLYVQKQMDKLLLQKQIRLDAGKPPSTKLQRLIVMRLCDEAQGMFRWVSLQLDYICTLHKASDIQKRLGKLPKNLSNSYQELYDRKFEEYEPEDRKRLEIALSLLLVSLQPTDPDVFSKFVFWDNDEDEEEEEEEEEEEDDDENASISYADEIIGTGDDSDSHSDLEHLRNTDETEGNRAFENSAAYIERDEKSSHQYEGVTRLCFDLIVFDSAAYVFRFAHTSVQDYLVSHSQKYQSRSDNHARLAERCMSILLHNIQSRRSYFPKYLTDEYQIQAWAEEEHSPNPLNNEEKHRSQGSMGKRPISRLINLKLPTYTRLHTRQIDTETLEEYQLPWRRDERDWDYILIMQWVSEWDQEFLLDHTRQIRALRPTGREKVLSKRVRVHQQGDSNLVVPMSTTHGKSRLPSRSSGGQGLQVPDFWYFDTPQRIVTSLVERFLGFVDDVWAFYTANSDDARHAKTFKELEDELQIQFTRQSWETVRPWTFFSACYRGLTSHVQAWIEAYPQLARTAYRFPHITTALMEMCKVDQIQPQIAKMLIDNGAEFCHLPRRTPQSLLCTAAGFGQEAMTRLLLEKRPDLGTSRGPRMFSPLTWAVICNPANAASIVQILLNHGANPDEVYDKQHNYRPLHFAAKKNVDVTELLLDHGAFIDAQDDRGLTPLVIAMMNGSIECCRLLLARGADVSLIDVNGNGLFTLAIINMDDPLLAWLLLVYGANINEKNRFGNTALHLATFCTQKRAGYAKKLIDWGIDVNAANRFGETPLHWASRRVDAEVTKMFIAAGADVNLTDIFGHKALNDAVRFSSLETVTLLLQATTDLDQQDCDGRTVLSLAAEYGKEEMVPHLLVAGAQLAPQVPGPHCPFLDPEERVLGYYQDPILAALENGHLDVARTIMEFFGGWADGGEFSDARDMIVSRDMDGLRRWSAIRRRKAPHHQADIVAFRIEVCARYVDVVMENERRIAAEVGIPYVKPVDCFEVYSDSDSNSYRDSDGDSEGE